jgi:hypothetical protein
MADAEEELVDYEEEAEEVAAGDDAAKAAPKKVGGSYVGLHSTGFKDFLLKPEILRAIVDCGFEHPSEGAMQAGSRSQPAWRASAAQCAATAVRQPCRRAGAARVHPRTRLAARRALIGHATRVADLRRAGARRYPPCFRSRACRTLLLCRRRPVAPSPARAAAGLPNRPRWRRAWSLSAPRLPCPA